MIDLLEQLRLQLAPFRHHRRWLLAYSGGLDSSVLLNLLWQWRESDPRLPSLLAVHINHQLQSASMDWMRHCRSQCAALDIPLLERSVVVVTQSRGSLEAAAREQRYRAFEEILEPGDLLLMAHHQDDQAETLLLRMMRGTGVRGLAGMPAGRALGRGQLWRPLLDCSRQQLQQYAASQRLQWIDDPSNCDSAFDRNYLRQQVMPLLQQRWPGVAAKLAQTADHAAEADGLLDALAALDLQQAVSAQDMLSVKALLAMSAARRNNLLRYWLRASRLELSAAQLRALVDTVLLAAADASPRLQLGTMELRRFRDQLCLIPAMGPPPQDGLRHTWEPPGELRLEGAGVLRATPSDDGGLRSGIAYEVGLRRGGERCHLYGESHSRSVKKLLQASSLPPWWRDRVPMLYAGDTLAAVADLWICDGFESPPGEPGWKIEWQRE